MTEEWPASIKSQQDSDKVDERTEQGIDSTGRQAPSDHQIVSNDSQAVPPRYPAGTPDFSGGGNMVPPPPVAPDAAAAAAAAAVAGYPPMHGYQQPPWQPYGPPPPMPYGGMYPPPFANPYGPPLPYQQAPPHMPPPHYYDPNISSQGPYDPSGGGGPQGYQQQGKNEENDDDEEDNTNPEDELGTYGAAARMKMYVKSKVPTRQEILDRRARKNAQSRARAAKLRERIGEIKNKPESERTEEEKAMIDQFESRRSRKNDRSRERAIEKKSEIDRILNKPERKRTKLEKQFLETALTAKQRKNEGDRLRRQRIKMMGKKGDGRGNVAYSGGGDIPMSPLPSQFGSGYPGAAAAYPSPRHAAATGALEASGGGSAAGPGVPLPFIPPPQQYNDPQSSPQARSQLHLPQNSSQVEQRRHPDGSMSISIGGSRPNEEVGDMAQMLLYGENGEGEGNPDQSNEAEV